MISITVSQYDRETEVGITAAKSGIDPEDAGRIVDVVRDFRGLGILPANPTVRACIMIAKVTALRGASVACDDPVFHETCRDVLRIDAIKITRDGSSVGSDWLEDILARNCPRRGESNGHARPPIGHGNGNGNGHGNGDGPIIKLNGNG